MRISSNKLQKEGNTSSDSITLGASGDNNNISESLAEEGSEPLNPAKGDVDDAYTLLLSKNESEQKVKVAKSFPFQKTFYFLIKGRL